MSDSFTLSLAAVDVLWEQLRLGVLAYPFDIPSNGVTHEERAAIRAAVFEDLARRGLASDGQVEPGVAATCTTLARPDVSVSAIGLVADRELQALAGSARQRAVLAVQRDQRLSFDLPTPSGLVGALLGLLPKIGAGIGQSVTISGQAGERSEKALARSYLERPRTAYGRLSVGGPRTVPFELNWFDTDRGRYICYRTCNRDGATWVTYAPADRGRMTQLLTEAMAGGPS